MQWLAEICVKRPVFASVLSIVILVVGGAFYRQLGVDQFPKIDFPAVVIFTRLPGAAPQDVETEISDKIEGAVNTISGIDELRSISAEGLSQVIVQFILEKNVDVASQEVQQKVNGVLNELPKGIEPPVIQKFDPDAQPVLYIALNSEKGTPRQITDLADRVVRRRLESINGVGEVRLLGGQKRQINVSIDPVKLRALGIAPAAVQRAIDAQNLSSPGGRIDTSRDYLTVRINGRVESVEQLERIVIRELSGRAVRLNEVATVEDGTEDIETSAFWNGKRTVILTLRKQSGTNTVAVIDAVKERMAEIAPELPAGYTMDIQRDASLVIRTGIEAVTEHLILGALFAAIIVLLFLGNLRATIIAAVAIPTSIIGTFALMYMRGYTLNSITLLALALAVGIVIDDAIVVLENIFKHIEEDNMHPMEAAVYGTQEIGLAVLATTLSLIAVFLPIAFVAGIPGRFLGSFGFTMSFAIAVSLFVSFTLTPMLASRFLKAKKHGAPKSIFEKLVDWFYYPIERLYMRLLGWSMKHRPVIVVLSVIAFFATIPLGVVARKGFLPVDDRAQFEIVARLPEGRSVAAAEVIGERIARLLRERSEVIATLTTVGDDAQKTPNQARVYVKLLDPDKRAISQNDFKEIVRQEILPTLPADLRVQVADVNEFGGGQATQRIQYSLAGPDLDMLTAATPRIIAKMKQLPGAVDVDSTLIVGKPEYQVNIDRDKAADLGVQVADLAQALNLWLGGIKVSTYEDGGEQYDVRMRSTNEFRTSEEGMKLMTVPSTKLGLVTLDDLVTVKHGESPSTINRFQRERQVSFLANAGPGASEGTIGTAIRQILDKEISTMPKGFSVKAQGQTKLMAETGKSFVFGLLASLIFMYLILAAQFESWLHPFTITLSLLLTLPFAVASIVIFRQALDLYSFLGIFVLFGVVKKNAILQIDHTNKLRERGMERDKAILQANKDRLRPILMTTFAFVAGMVPLVTAQGVGSGYNKATAGVVVGGQVMSLVLTLVAVPVAYSYFDDISLAFSRWWKRRFAHADAKVTAAHSSANVMEEASK